ncbi:MAG: hypothetical protein CMO40_02620 [Verrucomicrobiaceae bacterium]|nr:hypothetical protein [Verrucomicrobiaceae bacterium]
MIDSSQQPAWASPDVYPEKPDSSPFGALSRQGRRSEFETSDALSAHVRSSRDSVEAVWTPESDRMQPPEAVSDLLEPLRERFLDLAEADSSDARRTTGIFAVLLVWALYANVANRTMPTESVEVGLAAILLVLMGLVPYYDAQRNRRSARELDPARLKGEEQEARFERWLGQQRRIFTYGLISFLVVTGAVQIWVEVEASAGAAGLDKERYRAGEIYRLFTAPFLHGHALHWVLNVAGLWYIGRRVEALASWPHLVMVFLAAMLAGGVTSAQFMPEHSSLGASGGLMGLLGFLLVFETLHARLVPHPTRRRLGAALLVTFVIGVVGYRFIDNYAHAGGLVAGMIYGGIVFPRSRSVRRPRANRVDFFLGGAALVVLTGSASVAVLLMLAS